MASASISLGLAMVASWADVSLEIVDCWVVVLYSHHWQLSCQSHPRKGSWWLGCCYDLAGCHQNITLFLSAPWDHTTWRTVCIKSIGDQSYGSAACNWWRWWKCPARVEKRHINHPTLEMLSIANDCDLSQKPIIKTLVPVLYHIEDVQFIGASVGYNNSYGPKLIAIILASNPSVKALSLNFNALEDSGNYLRVSMSSCCYDRRWQLQFQWCKSPLFIDLLSASGFNMLDDPKQSRRVKIFSKINSNFGGLCDAVPIELLPH